MHLVYTSMLVYLVSLYSLIIILMALNEGKKKHQTDVEKKYHG